MKKVPATLTLLALAAGIATAKATEPTQATSTPERQGPCFARLVPERMDDFAWENDRIAFRMYGPALGKAEPNTSGSGVDVFVKKVRYPIIDKWYAKNDYHRDHGEGLDYYKVGTSRGCGGLGIWNGTSLDVSRVFARHNVIQGEGENISFELEYDPWVSGPATVSEVKRIRMKAGSNFYEVNSTFRVEGAKEVTIAAGIVLRREKGGELRHGDNWIAYAEPPDRRHGQTFCALIMPQKAAFKEADGHALLLVPVKDGGAVTYLAGAAWDRGLDFKSPEAWFEHVKKKASEYAY
jgi:unsaturated rhamnogalacturonyl hydrolase